jgi:serine/threonine protein kinase
MSEFELFQAALEIDDPVARQQFLTSSCHADAALLSRVEALLTSHEGQSRFLQIPVVEQIADVSERGAAATMAVGSGSTHDDEPDATAVHGRGAATMTELSDEADDEIPLGYLEPSSKPDSLGRLGHYEVLEVVGRGAFGTVLRAFDEKLHRVVAIKVMAPELASTSPARKRFLREAQASAAIRHEHVVSIYAVEEKPIPYLVMEYIPGQTLQQRLDERGPLEILSVLRLGRQIAEGLAAAHAINLIHRDIKPGNILLETGVQERVKITDFGLARTVDDASLTQSGMIAGTPMYMAPEQALGKKLDQRADLFSFGSVLYQMVSGRPPFRAPTALAVIKRVAEEAPRPISEIIPETPQWLCDIITKLHAKNPDDRYQSAREVADVLADCEAQLKANAKLQDFSRIPQAKRAKSAPWPWFTAGSVLGAMVLFGLIFITLTNKDGTKTTIAVPVGSSVSVDAGKDGRIDVSVTNPIESPPSQRTSLPGSPAEGQSPDQNWVQLFNGQDLTGWKTQPDAPGHWEVKDGILMGSQRPSVLFSERGDYANFHLRADVKINQGGDSGIIFRSGFENPPGKEAWPLGPIGGYEAEIHKQPTYTRRTGTVLALRRNAPLYLGKMTDDSLTRPDEWFTLEIIAEQNRFLTKVNGVVAANCSDPLDGDSSGHIALQVWNPKTIVQFRKIEIRELPATQPVSDDFVPLFNGQDLTGWKTTAELPGQWEVKDGILTGRSQQSYLYSERSDFANFHLRMEVKNNGLGDSGLYLRAPFSLRHGPRAGQTQPSSGYEINLFNRPVPLGTISEIVKGAPQRILCRAVDNTVYWAGEWFILEVIANENHFITRVNGQETINCRDSASRYARGHLALALYNSQSVVQFRKIEIKELPPPAPSATPAPQPQFYPAEEWIDVLPLIDPSLDKWDMRLTGQNDWRIEQGELLVGSADDKPCKLLLPLDADFFPSFEWELEVTRRKGDQGFNLNFPTANGDTPLSIDFPTKPGVFVRHARSGIMPINEAPFIETGKRITIRIEVRRQQAGDKISVWNNDVSVGTWTGDRNELASGNNEGYEHRRRLSLWIHGGGNEFVFHRIRVRPLDGGNAESLRPAPSAAPIPVSN